MVFPFLPPPSPPFLPPIQKIQTFGFLVRSFLPPFLLSVCPSFLPSTRTPLSPKLPWYCFLHSFLLTTGISSFIPSFLPTFLLSSLPKFPFFSLSLSQAALAGHKDIRTVASMGQKRMVEINREFFRGYYYCRTISNTIAVRAAVSNP
jgi:hypothetical protein